MLKFGRVAKFKMLFLVLVFVFNFDLFKFSAAILEKGLFHAENTLSSIANQTASLPLAMRFYMLFYCLSFCVVTNTSTHKES